MKKIKHKKLFILLTFILTIAFIWLIFAIIPPKKNLKNNPFITSKEYGPLIAAHRGGAKLNPENTFLAFDYAINNCDIDILELDLCMTKDKKLVVIHNFTLNSCTDIEEIQKSNDAFYVIDYTLEQLQSLNFGYKFVDSNGKRIYENLLDDVSDEDKSLYLKASKLRIVTIEELFEAYYKTDLKFIIEIKNKDNIGKEAADILYTQINKYNLFDRVVVGTFNTEVENYLSTTYPDVLRGGSEGNVARFIITQMFGVNIFDNSSFACLQICPIYEVKSLKIKLDKQTYINRAHKRNISVQFWTINDKKEMRELINKGVDVIMTDNPDILYELLKEMNYR